MPFSLTSTHGRHSETNIYTVGLRATPPARASNEIGWVKSAKKTHIENKRNRNVAIIVIKIVISRKR